MSFIMELLELIETVGGLMPGTKGHYRSISSIRMPTFYKSLGRLEKRNLIKKKRNRYNQVAFVITEEGKGFLHKPKNLTPRGDGYSTIVAFDIPETYRKQRDTLRRYLLRNGYTLIQKSLFISRHKIHKELVTLLKDLKLSSFVKIISGKVDYINYSG